MNIKRLIAGPILSLVFLLFFIYVLAGVQWVFDGLMPSQSKQEFLSSVSGSVKNIAIRPDVEAKAAISIESNLGGESRVLFEKEGNIQLPIASLTKLMTAIVVLDNYDLSSIITVDKAADFYYPLDNDVKLGDTLPVESLLEIMLIGSSNRAAYVLAEGPQGNMGVQKFVNLMNQKAEELGLQNTYFSDPTGLSPNNISTASDLAKLGEYILRNYPKISDVSKAKEFYVPNFGNISNTDQLLGEIPEVVCSKTGFTAAAKGCLLLVVNNPKSNGYLINVILGADDRFSDMKKVIDWSNSICN